MKSFTLRAGLTWMVRWPLFLLLAAICVLVLPAAAAPNVSGTYADAIKSIAHYQVLADAAYATSITSANVPTGFTLVDMQSDSSTGFRAKTFRSRSSREIVVAYAGTDPGYDSAADMLVHLSSGVGFNMPAFISAMRNDAKHGLLDLGSMAIGLAALKDQGVSLPAALPDDLKTDWDLAYGGIPEQFNQALAYLENAVANNRSFVVTTTGHSLGGAQAIYTGAVLGKDAVAFNSPLLNTRLYSKIPPANRVSRSTGPFLLNLFAETTDSIPVTDLVSHPPSVVAKIMLLQNDVQLATLIPVAVKTEKVVDRVYAWIPKIGGDPILHSIKNFESDRLDLSKPSINELKVTIGVINSDPRKTWFSDVEGATVYEPYIVELVRAGLSSGKSPSLFGVNDNLQRDEAASFLVNVAKSMNKTRGPGSKEYLPAPMQSYLYIDLAANNPHRDNIFTLAANGVVSPPSSLNNQKFRPADTVTSGEFAKMIMQAFDLPANGLSDYVAKAYKHPIFKTATTTTTIGSDASLVACLRSLQKLHVWRKFPWSDAVEKPDAIARADMAMSHDADNTLNRGEAAVLVANVYLFMKQNFAYQFTP